MSERRSLVASSRRLEPEERFDLLIHVLAQLPDDVRLEIWGDGPERPRLERLADAYGIADRLLSSSGAPHEASGQIVHPSPRNAETAPLQSMESITLDVASTSGRPRRAGVVTTPAQLVAALSRHDDPPASRRADPELLEGERVAIVTNQPAPYRVPLFERLADVIEGAGAAFRVFFLASHATGRPWMSTDSEVAFDHTYVPSMELPVRERPPAVPLRIERDLDAFSPTLIVVGGFSPFAAVRLALYATRRKLAYGLWSGEHDTMRTAKSRVRLAERRWVAHRASFAISYGSRSAEYLRRLRSDLPIVYGRNTSTFAAARAPRSRDGAVEILSVGDLASPRKGIDLLIDALARVPDLRCRLTVVGGGELLPNLAARARHDSRIRFLGTVPPRRVRDLYVGADVFAFPSRSDVFGLAPVEAMGTGLPSIVSAAPGMVADLCVDGDNCLVVEGDDASAWAGALERLVDEPELRARLGAQGARTVAGRWTIDHATDAMIAGLRLGVLARQAGASADRVRTRSALARPSTHAATVRNRTITTGSGTAGRALPPPPPAESAPPRPLAQEPTAGAPAPTAGSGTDTAALAPPAPAGALVARARREAGLTQAELAERIGTRLWTIERLERGETEGNGHLTGIARATGKDLSWFGPGLLEAEAPAKPPFPGVGENASTTVDSDSPPPALPLEEDRVAATWDRRLILGSIAVLAVVRFFTEIVPVLPRAANFVDVLVLFALGAMAVGRRPGMRTELSKAPFITPALLFLVLAILSAIVNLGRVEPGPVLLFLYGFLAPLGVFYATWRLWTPGHALSLSRLIVALGIVQFAVVLIIDLPLFLSTHNPDVISGTFGDNAYQLVFFLVLFASLVAGIATFEPDRHAARLAPLLIGASFLVIFLAQYRALLVTTALACLLVGLLLRSRRGFFVGSLVLVAFVGALTYVASRFPITKFQPTVTALRERPTTFTSARLGAADDVLKLYDRNPQFIVTGSGPGTYSSRAWRTFALLPTTSKSDVAGPYVAALTGGRGYRSDVAERYVVPRYENAEAILGSSLLNQPFSSYLALLAEVGVAGFLLLVGIYAGAFVRALRFCRASVSTAVPGDPVPALAVAAVTGLFVLLQMAFLENWWETSRVTFPAWIILAVVTKELEARRRSR